MRSFLAPLARFPCNIATVLAFALICLVVPLAFAGTDAGSWDASMSMSVGKVAVAPLVVVQPAPILTAPAWLSAHWPLILLILGVWTVLASALARRWPMPVSPPASRYKVLAHIVLVDWPAALPVREMAGIFGLPVSIPFVTLSQHVDSGGESSITDRMKILPPVQK